MHSGKYPADTGTGRPPGIIESAGNAKRNVSDSVPTPLWQQRKYNVRASDAELHYYRNMAREDR